MEHEGISSEKYRRYAYPQSGEAYFDAADFHPVARVRLAQDAGMKWMCRTTRHHDGFSLFDSRIPMPLPACKPSIEIWWRNMSKPVALRAAGAMDETLGIIGQHFRKSSSNLNRPSHFLAVE